MHYSKPVTEIIKHRFSCRRYKNIPSVEEQELIKGFISSLDTGPLGAKPRFFLIGGNEPASLRGPGTYGIIRGRYAYIIGSITGDNLEDFGYMTEKIVLYAEDLGLGTCWLGGTFTKSGLAEKISLSEKEKIPAVLAIGRIADRDRKRKGLISRLAGADKRKPWEELFYHNDFNTPLKKDQAEPYLLALEMVRQAPSGSNQQPWRIIKERNTFHFYLKRTRGYRENFFYKLMKCEDIQRIDIGIAMCHFELTAKEIGLIGIWNRNEPEISKTELTEYIISWIS